MVTETAPSGEPHSLACSGVHNPAHLGVRSGRVAVTGILAGEPQGAELYERACLHVRPLSAIFTSAVSQLQSIPLSSQHSILAQYRFPPPSLQAPAIPVHVPSCARETTAEETLLFSFTSNFCFTVRTVSSC